jgi:hypothetical protein
MVGKRRPFTGNGNANGKGKDATEDNSTRKKPIGLRFQDISNQVLEDRRREDIKNLLIDGMERNVLEGYRKSADEVNFPHQSSVGRIKLTGTLDQGSEE